MNKARLHELYVAKIRPELQERLQLGNVMEVPRIAKIVVNVGVSGAVSDTRALKPVKDVVRAITGQEPVETLARKSIAGFKIREGMKLGVTVTLRGKKMYEYLDKLINLALPKVRDFQGVSPKLDGRGNYNLGIKECNIFLEAESAGGQEKPFGLNVTIVTTARNDQQGYELIKSFGMPFRKK